jgi:hypothetical protein
MTYLIIGTCGTGTRRSEWLVGREATKAAAESRAARLNALPRWPVMPQRYEVREMPGPQPATNRRQMFASRSG